MSHTVSMDLRLRWGARSVILTKWLTKGEVRQGDEICELSVDGETRVVKGYVPGMVSTDFGGVIRACLREGEEVGPSGDLLWVSTSAGGKTLPQDAPLITTARMKLARRAEYPPIFISYRRTDTDAAAGRLHEALVSRRAEDAVFLDQFSIRAGEIWPWTIQQAVTHCKLAVVLVGPAAALESESILILSYEKSALRSIAGLRFFLCWYRGPKFQPATNCHLTLKASSSCSFTNLARDTGPPMSLPCSRKSIGSSFSLTCSPRLAFC